jgi:hypothetical protein
MVMEDAASTSLYMLLLRRDPLHLKSSAPKRKSVGFARNLKYGVVGIIAYLWSFTKCRTIVETDTLGFALALFWTQPGDLICQFTEYAAPVVLRKQEEDKYKFIGDCYVLWEIGQAMIEILGEIKKTLDEIGIFDLM